MRALAAIAGSEGSALAAEKGWGSRAAPRDCGGGQCSGGDMGDGDVPCGFFLDC